MSIRKFKITYVVCIIFLLYKTGLSIYKNVVYYFLTIKFSTDILNESGKDTKCWENYWVTLGAEVWYFRLYADIPDKFKNEVIKVLEENVDEYL